jgi:hypothetical protein
MVPTWGNLNGPANSAAILSWDRFFPTGQPYPVPLVPTLTNQNNWWLLASIFLLASLTGCLFLSAKPRLLLALGLAVLVPLSVAANQTQDRDIPNEITDAVVAIEAIDPDPGLAEIDFLRDCRDSSLGIHQAVNWLPYWLSPRTVTLVSLKKGQSFDSDIVVACGWWPEADDFGALPFDGGTDYGYRVWVLPGELQDTLAAEGRLLTLEDVGATGEQ